VVLTPLPINDDSTGAVNHAEDAGSKDEPNADRLAFRKDCTKAQRVS
jgi:hypothetical protein